jgi:hypothetical protein
MENNASKTWEFWKKKKIEKNYANRTKFEKDDKRYSFGIKLCERMGEKGYTAESLKGILDEMLPKAPSLQTIRDWMQQKAFPDDSKTMAALCYIFRPYSFEYFSGIIDEEPNRDIQFIKEHTGLPDESTIDRMKELFDRNPVIMKSIVESHIIDDLIQCIESSQGEKHRVLTIEESVIKDIDHYIDYYNSPNFNSARSEARIELLQNKINSLSDEEINVPFSNNGKGGSVPAFDIAAYKLRLMEAFNTYFNSVVKLESLHYSDLNDIFEKFIKPTGSFDAYSEEYYERILFPLINILKQEKIPQYSADTHNGKVIENKETKRKLSALYEKAQQIIEASGYTIPKKPTQKKSKRKKV